MDQLSANRRSSRNLTPMSRPLNMDIIQDDEDSSMEVDEDDFEEGKSGKNCDKASRKKSCMWCNNRKCNHCRCSGYDRCDHSSNEPCKRGKYGRRLVCNTCERNKLKDGKHGTSKSTKPAVVKDKKMDSPASISSKASSPSLSHGRGKGYMSNLFMNMHPIRQEDSQDSLYSTPKRASPATLFQSATAYNLTTTTARRNGNKPNLNICTVDDDCFDLALQSLLDSSLPTTPNDLFSFNTMPLSPLMQYPTYPMPGAATTNANNNSVFTFPVSFSPPATPSMQVDPSYFLDLMSTMDFQQNKTDRDIGIKGQPISEPECGSDKDSMGGMASPHSTLLPSPRNDFFSKTGSVDVELCTELA
jgi:hypothetical protein